VSKFVYVTLFIVSVTSYFTQRYIQSYNYLPFFLIYNHSK